MPTDVKLIQISLVDLDYREEEYDFQAEFLIW